MLIPVPNVVDVLLHVLQIKRVRKLSPRKIMMDTSDRLEEVGKNIDANKGVFVPDNKSLLNDYITQKNFGLVHHVMLVLKNVQ
jgi:hypothetical protein